MEKEVRECFTKLGLINESRRAHPRKDELKEKLTITVHKTVVGPTFGLTVCGHRAVEIQSTRHGTRRAWVRRTRKMPRCVVCVRWLAEEAEIERKEEEARNA